MTRFAYSAVPIASPGGSVVRGDREAPTERALRESLRTEGLLAIDVKPMGLGDALKLRSRSDRLRGSDASWFFSTLSALLGSSVPIESAVGTLEELAPSDRLRSACAAVRSDLRSGRTLAEAVAAAPGLAQPQHVAVLRTASRTGRLDHAVALVERSIAATDQLKRTIAGKLAYPAIVLLAAFGVVWFLAVFVIPEFEESLATLGSELPWQTELTLTAAAWLTWTVPAAAVVIAGLVAGRRSWLTPVLLARLDGLALRAPLVGPLLWHARAGAATEVMATMIEGGGDVLGALEQAEEVVGSPVLASRIAAARTRVREGADPGEALTSAGEPGRDPRGGGMGGEGGGSGGGSGGGEGAVLPPMIGAVVRAGVASGALASSLRRASELCRERQERLAARLLIALEPAIVGVLAGVVGWVVYSLVVGMLTISDASGL